MPPSQTSGGCCSGLGSTRSPSKWNRGPSWSTTSSSHRRRMSGSASSNQAARSLARDAEGLLLVRVGDAEAEGRQQPSAGQAVEGGQLLGQHDRVAAGEHQHARAELQLGRAAGGVGHADDRVGGLAADALGEPEAVEAQPLEGVDRLGEALVVERCACRGRSRCGSSPRHRRRSARRSPGASGVPRRPRRRGSPATAISTSRRSRSRRRLGRGEAAGNRLPISSAVTAASVTSSTELTPAKTCNAAASAAAKPPDATATRRARRQFRSSVASSM